MKVVHYSRGMSKASCRGTINELKVLRRLAEDVHPHPFLLQPYVCDGLWAWRSSGGYLHVLTELCTGGDLSYYKRLLSERTLSLICAEVILGLDHLHGLDIVHHDVKPQNILVNAAGHCVLSDYGGAQFLDEGGKCIRRRERGIGNAVMTIPFAAPELLCEDNRFPTYNVAVDYWSLAATLVSLVMDDDFLPGAQDMSMLTFRLRRIEKKMRQLGKSEEFVGFVMAVCRRNNVTHVRLCSHPSRSAIDLLLTWSASLAFEVVKDIGALAHGYAIEDARVHETRAPVDLLAELRQEQLSLVLDDSFDVRAQQVAVTSPMIP
ncbi:kinase-like protein [Trametes punicea]|nr:kinase-like protein [Trametes punicea]